MRGHADAETLAAFHEELLPRRKTAQVAAHLVTCPRCAALDAQLAEVTALLTHATAPPMPDALAARIEAALAAEAAARGAPQATVPAPAAPALNGSPGSAGRDGGRGRRAGRAPRGWSSPALRIATVAAAVAVVAGGGYTVAQLLSGGPIPHATGSSGALAPPASGAGASRPKSPVFGGPADRRAAPSMGALNHASAATAQAPVITSNTNYQPSSLGAQASTVLATLGIYSGTHPGPALATPPTSYALLFPSPQACAAHVAPGLHPLLIDEAHYQGHPALIIVLPATHTTRSKVLVIAPGCTSTTAHILATATLPPSG